MKVGDTISQRLIDDGLVYADTAETGRNISDARLVLLAYQRWADACVARLLGPFALGLVERPKQSLPGSMQNASAMCIVDRATDRDKG